jgi:peptidoglycan hydrolase-like protein with peptidoglycan-binding domain
MELNGETIPQTLAPEQAYKAKALPLKVQYEVNERDRAMYNTVQWIAGRSDRQVVQASVLLISGCQDNQLSYDGNYYGQFTGTLLSVWDNGSFDGGYSRFHKAILTEMPPDQTPNYFTTGARSQAFEDQKPFTIESPVSGGVVIPVTGGASPSATTASRPTLRRGDRGGDVVYLQERLTANGYSTVADGIFGSGTEQIVRQFQRDRGLTADGVVGALTWAALQTGSTGYGPSSAGGAEATGGLGSGGSGGWSPGGPASTGPAIGGSTATSKRPTLCQGDTGEHVLYLQQMLRNHGYSITPDGIFGGHTASIVRHYQRDNGLSADGIAGPLTWAALES